MKIKLNKSNTLIKFSVIFFLVIGIFFRFANIDTKSYWRDEVFTSFMISGYCGEEIVENIGNGDILTIKDLEKYQTPNSEKNLKDMLIAKAQCDSQHPPLYYVIARFWAIIFGNSPASLRSLSAIIGLLIFPAFYWLCVELFEVKEVGWFAITLISVSLFHVMYAQEARPYSLWTITTLFSCSALLRAIRFKDSLGCWAIYIVTAVVGIYTFPFTVFTLIGHGLYVLITERFRLSKTLVFFLVSSLLIVLCFFPWILVIFKYTTPENNAGGSWLKQEVGLSYLAKMWALNLSYIFLSAKPRIYTFILILEAYSMYYVFRKTPERIWLFIFTLTFSIAIPLLLVDIFLGYKITKVARYMIPVYLGIQLAVAYVFTDHILLSSSKQIWKKRIWLIVMIMIVALGFWSCTRYINAEQGWNKGNLENIPMAQIINNYTSPLIIGEVNGYSKLTSIFSVSYMLNPKVKYQLLDEPHQFRVNNNLNDFTGIFLLNPSKYLLEIVEENGYSIDQTYKKLPLIKIKK
ncbi:glycosyltransferase family 39 protein [Dapis sp. BLCC M229]|uniref:glycosyltransferase family 39 protein n=1 Tax=Dapis sp. BLCC M229 TaxID=3400188 RepID=UPI003CF4B135